MIQPPDHILPHTIAAMDITMTPNRTPTSSILDRKGEGMNHSQVSLDRSTNITSSTQSKFYRGLFQNYHKLLPPPQQQSLSPLPQQEQRLTPTSPTSPTSSVSS
jgi:hypothetical protein